MATDTPVFPAQTARATDSSDSGIKSLSMSILKPLASLKLTVVLFALAILSVLFTTLAQATDDIWIVIDTYVRVDASNIFTPEAPFFHPIQMVKEFVVMVPNQVLFPPSFFPRMDEVNGSFPFPKGWLIGLLMGINLFSAHLIRFKTQAKGSRLFLGWGIIAIGCLVTWGVIISGSDHDGVQTDYSISWEMLWRTLQVSLVLLTAGLGFAYFQTKPEQKLHRSLILLGIALTIPFLVWMFYTGSEVPIDASGMRILWQLVKGIAAGGVLLAGCSLVFKKRAGVVLLHAGVGLMMFYEVLVGVAAEEAQMMIVEGETVNFARDNRSFELAITQPIDAESENVTVVPQRFILENLPPSEAQKENARANDKELEPPAKIANDELPFVVQVEQYFQNAKLVRADSAAQDRVTAGLGKDYMPLQVAGSTGAGMGEGVDQPAAYLALYDKADPTKLLSRNLVSAAFDLTGEVDEIPVGDEKYAVALRFKRVYKPYAIKLEDVRKVDYEGTNIPRDYSSDIVLQDAEGTDLETRIWMNNPLRFGGETFYQSSYGELSAGKEYTVLQVVTNSGWMIPYVSCMIVAVGMLAQFLITLTRFLNRRSDGKVAVATDQVGSAQGMSHYGVLGVTTSASEAEIRKAHKKLSKHYHPDSNRSDDEAAERFREVEEAWDVLGTKSKRRDYDRSLSGLSPQGNQPTGWSADIQKWFPLAVTLLITVWLGSRLRQPSVAEDQYNLYAFGQIPIRDDGRLKPLDTVGRNTLRFLSKRNDFKDEDGNRQPATRFLADLMNGTIKPVEDKGMVITTAADQYDLFYIENDEAQEYFELERRKGFLYSYNELRPKLTELEQHLREVAEKQAKASGNEYQKNDPKYLMNLKLRELSRKIELYRRLAYSFIPADEIPPMPTPQQIQQNDPEAMMAAMKVKQLFETYPLFLQQLKAPLLIPMLDEDNETFQDEWEAYPLAYIKAQFAREWLAKIDPETKSNPLPVMFENIRTAWKDKDDSDKATTAASAKKFNNQVAAYLGYLETNTPPDLDKEALQYEAFYNKTEIYYYAAIVSIIAFIFGVLSWLGWSKALRSTAFWINVVLLIVHTYGLTSRIYISGRPPVTNLYSSALFIGWGAVALGLLLEWIYPIGIAVVVASAMGFATLFIAQLLSIDGDTIGVLQAVLDTQFWLATHVVCITFGYATTFLAGFLGLAYVVRGGLTKTLTPTIAKDLTRMIYGILCFSIFFSFVGTVLGGLWADDSWGRFWGWDPKENGALIIVLWNALVLHARWGGLVKDRGLAILAMGGNIATAWSWFGVNELGVGLHSYGFTDGVLRALGAVCLTQLVIIIFAAVVPQKSWLSFRGSR